MISAVAPGVPHGQAYPTRSQRHGTTGQSASNRCQRGGAFASARVVDVVSRRLRAGFVRVAAGSRLPDKEAIMATTEGLVGLVHVTANIAGQALYGSSAAILRRCPGR